MSDLSSVTDLRISLSNSSHDTLSTHSDYRYKTSCEILTTAKFHEVTDLLLEKPNLNSSHLFRADILWDSAGVLKTKAQHEASLNGALRGSKNGDDDVLSGGVDDTLLQRPPPLLDGTTPYRTVVRRLIPRNQNLDKPLDQSCYLYRLDGGTEAVLYQPHVGSAEDMPWYHPRIKALAYVFEPTTTTPTTTGEAAISLWHLPFDGTSEVPQRLHRTLLALGSTFLRLARYQAPSEGSSSSTANNDATSPAAHIADGDMDIDLRPSALKDTILPQHVVQDTYARLKTAYGPSLIASWVEATPPEKHVFEDLSIAAFLVCLWRKMYGSPEQFAGFVDLACGNGLLVYILNKEGWKGWGIDARRRKTWAALGMEEDGSVREGLIVPKPFTDALDDGDVVDCNATDGSAILKESGISVHSGVFEAGTFIISNHADELTLWTPLLAAISCPANPLPFLAIPCCSHALSGEKYRYSPKDASLHRNRNLISTSAEFSDHLRPPSSDADAALAAVTASALAVSSAAEQDAQAASAEPDSAADLHPHPAPSPPPQSSPSPPPPPPQSPPPPPQQQRPLHKKQHPEQGSLLALRATHQQERTRTGSNGNGSAGVDKSAYGCLTRKTVQVGRRLGVQTMCTLMRIPSTRNVGVVSLGGGAGAGEGAGGGAGAEWGRGARGGGEDGEGEIGEEKREGKGSEGTKDPSRAEWRGRMVHQVVQQECARSGGVRRSAEAWVERARKVHVGQGRGKVNWGGKRDGDGIGRGGEED